VGPRPRGVLGWGRGNKSSGANLCGVRTNHTGKSNSLVPTAILGPVRLVFSAGGGGGVGVVAVLV